METKTYDDDSDISLSEMKPASEDFKTRLQTFKHKSDTRSHDEDVENTNLTAPLRQTSQHRQQQRRPFVSSQDTTCVTKRRRPPSKYAPPSRYAHLPGLTDTLAPKLICIFVGTNPGIRTATSGHAYAHPSNLFWKLLHTSGCTDVRLRPDQDGQLPARYAMGNTNIVARPSKDAAELSKAEMAAGTPILEAKVAIYRPEAVCIVGKGIWEAVWRWRKGREMRKDEFRYGWQDDSWNLGREEEWDGARVYVTTSTSGLSASTRPHEKEAIWKPFGEWVMQRRAERARQVEIADVT